MLSMLWANKAYVQEIAYVAVFLLAMLRGARPERIMGGALLAMVILDAVHPYTAGGSVEWRQVNLGHAAIDCAMLPAVAVIALYANRVYPLWIGAAQIIAVLAHVYRGVLAPIDPFAYDMMSVMPSYVQLVAMAVGLACHMSRQRKLGSYRSWRQPLTFPHAARSSTG